MCSSSPRAVAPSSVSIMSFAMPGLVGWLTLGKEKALSDESFRSMLDKTPELLQSGIRRRPLGNVPHTVCHGLETLKMCQVSGESVNAVNQ